MNQDMMGFLFMWYLGLRAEITSIKHCSSDLLHTPLGSNMI